MSEDEWTAQVAQVDAAWNASGKSTLHGVCGVVTAPNGDVMVRQQCRFPNGQASGMTGGIDALPADGVAPCEDFWYNGICPTLKPGEPGYDKCQQTAPQECPPGEVWASWLTPPKCQSGQTASGKAVYACKSKTVPGSWDLYEPTGGFKDSQGDINVRFLRTVPSMEGYDAPNEVASISSPNFCALHSPEADKDTQPTPEPEPTPQTATPGEGQVPITIDIQAFTPQGTGPIPTQPMPQQQGPTQVPMQQEEQPAATKVRWVEPKPEKTLDTGSAVGIGAIVIAAAAAIFFGGK